MIYRIITAHNGVEILHPISNVEYKNMQRRKENKRRKQQRIEEIKTFLTSVLLIVAWILSIIHYFLQ